MAAREGVPDEWPVEGRADVNAGDAIYVAGMGKMVREIGATAAGRLIQQEKVGEEKAVAREKLEFA